MTMNSSNNSATTTTSCTDDSAATITTQCDNMNHISPDNSVSMLEEDFDLDLNDFEEVLLQEQ
eukprot:CAMPEP_0170947530 /NCGR_PEP_ID=MMETSP0735-20130129/27960_1 /TAXON_ID=186038 /ORGANISM="Fragilariopsis kerguelensis, Strain L26-C5" /LENGTH=62 /DNA_ID=CAMNT_0011356871 /DNA_START=228 /DNA_END=413 /DNA_ORIENTATION=-